MVAGFSKYISDLYGGINTLRNDEKTVTLVCDAYARYVRDYVEGVTKGSNIEVDMSELSFIEFVKKKFNFSEYIWSNCDSRKIIDDTYITSLKDLLTEKGVTEEMMNSSIVVEGEFDDLEDSEDSLEDIEASELVDEADYAEDLDDDFFEDDDDFFEDDEDEEDFDFDDEDFDYDDYDPDGEDFDWDDEEHKCDCSSCDSDVTVEVRKDLKSNAKVITIRIKL